MQSQNYTTLQKAITSAKETVKGQLPAIKWNNHFHRKTATRQYNVKNVVK